MGLKHAASDEDIPRQRDMPSRYRGRSSLQKPLQPRRKNSKARFDCTPDFEMIPHPSTAVSYNPALMTCHQSSPTSCLSACQRSSLLYSSDEDFVAGRASQTPAIPGVRVTESSVAPPTASNATTATATDLELAYPNLTALRQKLDAVMKESEKDNLTVIPQGRGKVIVQDTAYKFGDILWLCLKAFFANRPMRPSKIQASIDAQNSWILKQRSEKRSILNEIAILQFPNTPRSPSASASFRDGVFDTGAIIHLQNVLRIVDDILRRFYDFVDLFPDSLKMAELEKDVFTPNVRQRVTLLIVWSNCVHELYSRIHSVRDYFDVITDVRKRTSVLTSPQSPQSSMANVVWPSLQETGGSQGPKELFEAISSMYSTVVGRSLCLRGMSEVLERIRTMCHSTLEDAACFLQVQKLYAQAAAIKARPHLWEETAARYKGEQKEFTIYHPLFIEMNLPVFIPQFSFLVRVPVDLVHEWLQMRVVRVNNDDDDNGKLDLLTLNTLIEDSDDCLTTAIRVKNQYQEYAIRVCKEQDLDKVYLQQFDEKLDKVFENYLYYIRQWTQEAAASRSDDDVEWCEKLIAQLRRHWERVKGHSVSVSRGEALAAQQFCNVGLDLINNMIRGYLISRFDKAGNDLLDDEDWEGLLEDEDIGSTPSVGDQDGEDNDPNEANDSRVFVLCREFRSLLRHLRERTLKSIGFIKQLSSDLEVSARYEMQCCSADTIVNRLIANDHVMLEFPKYENDHCIDNCPFVAVAPRSMVNRIDVIDGILSSTIAYGTKGTCILKEGMSEQKFNATNYLILLPRNKISPDLIVRLRPRAATATIGLKARHIIKHNLTPPENNLYLLSVDRFVLDQARQEFERVTANCGLKLFDDFCACNDHVWMAIDEVKKVARITSGEVWEWASELEKFILSGKPFETLNDREATSLKATMRQAFNVAFEFDREVSRLISFPLYSVFAKQAVVNVKIWARFVEETVNAGHRYPSRWAAIPLGCIQLLISDRVVTHLDSDDFEELEQQLYTCLDLIQSSSSADVSSSTSTVSFRRMVSEDSGHSTSSSTSNGTMTRSLGPLSFAYFPGNAKKVSVADRIAAKAQEVDNERQMYLVQNKKIGVVESNRASAAEAWNRGFLRQTNAPFGWQRCENKILGKGSFGTCYLVINTQDKILMAMKQVTVCRENNNQLKSLIDEVDIFRQLNHPNLVKYYGVEVHKDECLIFMEYCSEGTLTRVCREGLDLSCVRRYTHYLLQAVDYLHQRQIIHRDIKPSNIFLTQKDVLKLGDFGCSFRLQDTATRMGEVHSYVGTPHYQAPELQTNTAENDTIGYGRAVDIWSTGCVVLEMLTGKRPFHYLEHELQIIFQLGSGRRPQFSAEILNDRMTHSFLLRCLEVNPQRRATAAELRQDKFANIDTTVLEAKQ